MSNQQFDRSKESAAAQWEHLASETKVVADHEFKIGVSSFPFGDERVPATHHHRTYMRTANELRSSD